MYDRGISKNLVKVQRELNIAQRLRKIITEHLKSPKPKKNQEVFEAERKYKKRFRMFFKDIKLLIISLIIFYLLSNHKYSEEEIKKIMRVTRKKWITHLKPGGVHNENTHNKNQKRKSTL